MPANENRLDRSLKLSIDSKEHRAVPRPISSPIALEGVDLSAIDGSFALSLLPPLPASPPPPGLTLRDPIKNNIEDALNEIEPPRGGSSHSDQAGIEHRRQWMRDEDDSLRPSSSSMSKIYHLRKTPGSTPELSLVGSVDSAAKTPLQVPLPSTNNLPYHTKQPSPNSSQIDNFDTSSRRKEKIFRNPLIRTKSLRKSSFSSRTATSGILSPESSEMAPPLPTDRSAMDMLRPKSKEKRGKSAERTPRSGSEDNFAVIEPAPRQSAPRDAVPASQKERTTFLTGSKNVLNKAKTGGGTFLNRIGKIGRSGSSHEKEAFPHVEEAYTLKTINLPLVEQTRITRISKSLDACKDKTEYWMPSLPWRCIDYLNLNCESEGLYRIPGSGPQIKLWQKRFDTELDIDLLDEQDLYDPNNISSLLKQWLRELPTEIIPADLQSSLAVDLEKENPEYTKMGQPAPQRLRDALSELSPFNYYLLFAITCHLSLLVSHQDKNRMDLNNLSICIGPCLKMERWLFNYLVGDWRHCWQGCWTEKQTLEAERKVEDPDYLSYADGEEAEYESANQAPPTSASSSIPSSAIPPPSHPPPQSPPFPQEADDPGMSSGAESMVSAKEDLRERPATAATSTSSRPQTGRDDNHISTTSTIRKPVSTSEQT